MQLGATAACVGVCVGEVGGLMPMGGGEVDGRGGKQAKPAECRARKLGAPRDTLVSACARRRIVSGVVVSMREDNYSDRLVNPAACPRSRAVADQRERRAHRL